MLLCGQVPNKEPGTYRSLNSAIGHLMSAYSRHDEKQADELSIRYMKRAGFDPKGVMQALEVLKKLRKKGPIMAYSVYKSHPYISERIANLKCEVKDGLDFDSYINIVSDKHALQ
jgi:predicted Zn-dependent protease